MKYPNDFINKNIVGDSVELMKQIPNNVIDLTVTSPPYDNLRTYKGKIKDNITFDNYSFPFQEIAQELYRITKKGGVVVWVVNDQVKNGGETGTSFRMALYFQQIGFTIYDTMIYHKNGSPFQEIGRYAQVFEYMFVFSKGKPNTVNLIKDKENRWAGYENFGTPTTRQKDGSLKKKNKFTVAKYGTRYNVWNINVGKGFGGDKLSHEHPASFPESLAEDHILTWSNEGDTILDPMCGAGTTQKMAKLNNRNYIGLDIIQEYIDISNRRVNLVSYRKDKPNPKVKFIVSRNEILDKRKKTKEEKLKKKEIDLTEKDIEIIFKNIENPKEPNDALKTASKEYKEKIIHTLKKM